MCLLTREAAARRCSLVYENSDHSQKLLHMTGMLSLSQVAHQAGVSYEDNGVIIDTPIVLDSKPGRVWIAASSL